MTPETIEGDFQKIVSSKIRLTSEGADRYRVFTPFVFEDGDHLAIVLKREKDDWSLSDEGNTHMHLAYDPDEKVDHHNNRHETIRNVLSVFQVEDRNGELILTVRNNQFGNALCFFIQALIKIAGLSEGSAPKAARRALSSGPYPVDHP